MKKKKKIGTMDLILILVGTFLLIFTGIMIYLHIETGTTPDTLITCVFACCGGECGIMGWIKTTKERRQDRKWELQDREEKKRDKAPEEEEVVNE